MTTHLFNDDMLAMIVEPNRHFRCETKLPEKSGDTSGKLYQSLKLLVFELLYFI